MPDGSLYFSQHLTYPAAQFRNFHALETGVFRGGVINAIGNELMVSVSSGFTLQVAAGRAWVPATDPALGHVEDLYLCDSPGGSVTIDAPDAALVRIDSVVLRAEDSTDATGFHRCYIAVNKGVPASTPTAPRPGALELVLAEVTVDRRLSGPTIDNTGRLHFGQVSRTGPWARQQATFLDSPTTTTGTRGHYEDEVVYDVTGHGFRHWNSGTASWAPVTAGAQVLHKDMSTDVHLTPSAAIVFAKYQIPPAPYDRTGLLVFHFSGWHGQEHAASYTLYATMDRGGARQWLTGSWYGNAPGVNLAQGATLTIPAGKSPLIEAEMENSNWGGTSDFTIDTRSNWLLVPGFAEQIQAIDV